MGDLEKKIEDLEKRIKEIERFLGEGDIESAYPEAHNYPLNEGG